LDERENHTLKFLKKSVKSGGSLVMATHFSGAGSKDTGAAGRTPREAEKVIPRLHEASPKNQDWRTLARRFSTFLLFQTAMR